MWDMKHIQDTYFTKSTGWIPGLRKGPFERYLQIRLGSKTKVTKVTITQKGIQKLKEILMQYSDDGINWANGDLVGTSKKFFVINLIKKKSTTDKSWSASEILKISF